MVINIMKLPLSHGKLKKYFHNASVPDLYEFSGEYLVNMLMIPGYRKLFHRKIFYRESNNVAGYNLLFNKRWGRFLMEEQNVNELKVSVINYDRAENSFLIRGIRDHLRRVEESAFYIGRFNYIIREKLYFLGYFTLEKIK